MTEAKFPENAKFVEVGVNPLLVALVAFLAGIALMYGIGMYITNRGTDNAGIDNTR